MLHQLGRARHGRGQSAEAGERAWYRYGGCGSTAGVRPSVRPSAGTGTGRRQCQRRKDGMEVERRPPNFFDASSTRVVVIFSQRCCVSVEKFLVAPAMACPVAVFHGCSCSCSRTAGDKTGPSVK